MIQATQTQKAIIEALNDVVNTFGGAKVHISIADHVQRAGMAIGLRILSGFYSEADHTIMLSMA